MKPRGILCPHQSPTRGDNTVSVAQGGRATPGATKQLSHRTGYLKEFSLSLSLYIYIYTPDKLKAEITLYVIFIFSAVFFFFFFFPAKRIFKNSQGTKK